MNLTKIVRKLAKQDPSIRKALISELQKKRAFTELSVKEVFQHRAFPQFQNIYEANSGEFYVRGGLPEVLWFDTPEEYMKFLNEIIKRAQAGIQAAKKGKFLSEG